MIYNMETKRNIIIIFCVILMYLMVGGLVFSFINKPNKQQDFKEKDVVNAFKDDLKKYDYKYDLDVFRFDEESLMKKAFGTVTFKDKLKTTCSISGRLEKKYSGERETGKKYVVTNGCDSAFEENINNYLLDKYNYIDISEGVDYNKAAKEVNNYIKEKQEFLDDYGLLKETDKEKKYTYTIVPFAINGEKFTYSIYIDKRNNKVIYDFSAGKHGFEGVSELSEYLELLAQNKIEEKTNEIRKENYGKK